jgi:hypothetical protein
MKIFAAAADYASWASLMDVKPGDAKVTGSFNQNAFYLGSQAKEIKVPVSGEKVFVKLGLAAGYDTDYNRQIYYSYGDKYFAIYDNNGKLRVSLERFVQFDGIDYVGQYRWNIWNPDTGTIITTGNMWVGKVWEDWKDVYLEVTTTVIKLYISGVVINTLDISSLGITGFGFIGFAKHIQWSGSTADLPRVLYMVISDTVDYSLRAYPYKPKALDSGNQFVGTIGALNSWIPDRTYMSSSAEYNVKCSFTLAVPASGFYIVTPDPDLSREKIIQIDQYVATRYVQSGGVTANFRIHNTVAGGPDDYVFACPANENDTKHIIRKLPTKTGTDLPNPANGIVEISLEA